MNKNLKDLSKVQKIVVCVVILILLVSLIDIASTPNVPQEITVQEEATEDSTRDLSSVALLMSEKFMERMLVSPATAEFAGLLDERDFGKMNDDTYFVVSYVDSQNGFGARLRSNYNMWLRYKGGNEFETSSWEITRWYVDGEDIMQTLVDSVVGSE
jgi:hypothetical protein